MTAPISGPSNLTPSYSKETEQEQMKRGGSSSGAILSKDSLEVPFEKQIRPESQEAEAGRPFLPPLFRMRFVEDRKGDDLSRDYYQKLRNDLPSLLKEKLKNDEEFDLADRNPDLVALDSSLKFEAQLLALTTLANVPTSEEAKGVLDPQLGLALPAEMQQELIQYGASVLGFLDRYLDSIGPNDPSYEVLTNIANQMQEGLGLLKLNREKEASEE